MYAWKGHDREEGERMRNEVRTRMGINERTWRVDSDAWEQVEEALWRRAEQGESGSKLVKSMLKVCQKHVKSGFKSRSSRTKSWPKGFIYLKVNRL